MNDIYDENEIHATATISFPDLQGVAEFLRSKGFRASRSTVYRHHAEKKIRAVKDGTFPSAAVLKYASKFLKRTDGESVRPSHGDDLQERKLRAEIDKLENQARAHKIRADAMTGNYIERTQFERELAARVSVFKNDLIVFWHMRAAEICALVNGDPGKIQDLIYFGMEAVEEFLDRYAQEGVIRPLPLPRALLNINEADKEVEMDEEDGFDN